MSEIVILDGSEVKLNESKSGKLTIIAGENASIPLSLLPSLKKKDLTVKTVKDIKDSCEIAFCLGQIFKPGDTLITDRPEFARFKEYADAKATKAKGKTETPKRIRKPKVSPEKEAEGAMPKPIEEKEPAKEKPKEDDSADMLGDIEALPTNEGYSKFTAFLKDLSISSAFTAAAKKLYKLSIDASSLKIMAQSDLKGLPAETAKKITEKIKELKKL